MQRSAYSYSTPLTHPQCPQVAHCIDIMQSDLLSALVPRMQGAVDILVFNPPYVPTPNEEVARQGIAAAWAGGDRGRVVVDRLLPMVPQVLAPGGVFYLVSVPENQPHGAWRVLMQCVLARVTSAEIARLLGDCGLEGCCVCTKRADEELLSVWRFVKS